MSCPQQQPVQECPDLLPKQIEIYQQYGNTVEQLMMQMKYGLSSCKKTKDFDLLDIRKQIVDWQKLD
jgi:hypothetical protein